MTLERSERRWFCQRGHSFDIAKEGYVNLLQPQDRRSLHAGDSAEARLARVAMHGRGMTAPFRETAARMLETKTHGALLDVGCGDGLYTAQLGAGRTISIGMDISVPAIRTAAKGYPECRWIVANADRFIPFPQHSFEVILSITARRNPAEFERIAIPGGLLLAVVPAPDDLLELRRTGRDRRLSTEQEMSDGFEPIAYERVTTQAELSATEVQQTLKAIYRPMQRRTFDALTVTFSLDFLLFRAKG